jgi:phosphodiesterase/alkaline phosphatase D-like protein
VHVDVGGLQPGRPYWYRFIAGGEASVIGRTRTAPARHAVPYHEIINDYAGLADQHNSDPR